jgi:hypothetical protein
MHFRKAIAVLLLLAVPVLVGAKCAFFFSTGDDSSDSKDDDKDSEVVIIGEGQLTDAPVEGANYVSGSISGITGSNGEFQYEVGKKIRFFIGDIPLGTAVDGKALVTPADLTGQNAADTVAAINVARLLYSLDARPGDRAITIPAEVRNSAIRSNASVSAAIDYLDFSDEQAFVNAASQLVAVLTDDYPFTAVLVEADAVRALMGPAEAATQ